MEQNRELGYEPKNRSLCPLHGRPLAHLKHHSISIHLCSEGRTIEGASQLWILINYYLGSIIAVCHRHCKISHKLFFKPTNFLTDTCCAFSSLLRGFLVHISSTVLVAAMAIY